MIVAKRYAQAFLSCYEHELNPASLEALAAFSAYSKQKKIRAYLALPAHPSRAREKLLLANITLPMIKNRMQSLLKLIEQHRRLFLLPEILEYIIFLYYKKNDILFFDLEHTHPLEPQEQETIRLFLEKKTKKNVCLRPCINTSLIAGIRAVNENFLWENSIKQKLRYIALSMNIINQES